jgi:hypothetical protein
MNDSFAIGPNAASGSPLSQLMLTGRGRVRQNDPSWTPMPGTPASYESHRAPTKPRKRCPRIEKQRSKARAARDARRKARQR